MAVKASLGSFMDYTSVVGPRRARVPVDLRAMYDDPTRHPWDYYGPMIDAVKGGFTTGDLQAQVYAAVDVAHARAQDRRFRGQVKHYEALAAGAVDLYRRAGPLSTFDIPTASWSHGSLTIRVSTHLGVQRRGRREAWLLYLKEPVLQQAAADSALIIMTEALAGTDLVPRVVDVRRATTFGLRANRSRAQLSSWVRGEAELFTRLWEESAA